MLITKISTHELVMTPALSLYKGLNVKRPRTKFLVEDGMLSMSGSSLLNDTRVFYSFDCVQMVEDCYYLILEGGKLKLVNDALLLACQCIMLKHGNGVLTTSKNAVEKLGKYNKITIKEPLRLFVQNSGILREVSILDEQKLLDWMARKLQAAKDKNSAIEFDNNNTLESIRVCISVV